MRTIPSASVLPLDDTETHGCVKSMDSIVTPLTQRDAQMDFNPATGFEPVFLAGAPNGSRIRTYALKGRSPNH